MKIKIIDLLNKSSNGEEMPKRIKYDLKEYFYCGYDYKIYDVEKQFDDDYNLWNNLDMYKLNNYVEITEEDKKIDFEEIEELTCNEYDFEKKTINSLIKNQRKLIEEINKLKENK